MFSGLNRSILVWNIANQHWPNSIGIDSIRCWMVWKALFECFCFHSAEFDLDSGKKKLAPSILSGGRFTWPPHPPTHNVWIRVPLLDVFFFFSISCNHEKIDRKNCITWLIFTKIRIASDFLRLQRWCNIVMIWYSPMRQIKSRFSINYALGWHIRSVCCLNCFPMSWIKCCAHCALHYSHVHIVARLVWFVFLFSFLSFLNEMHRLLSFMSFLLIIYTWI